MPYDLDSWRRCRKCGSYMPSGWVRCGRCGYSEHAGKSGRLTGWLIILVLIFIVFIFRGELLSLIPEPVRERFSFDTPADPSASGTARDPVSGILERGTPDPTGSDPQKGAYYPESTPNTQGNAGKYTAGETEIAEIIRNALKNAEKSVKLPPLNTGDDPDIIFGIIEDLILGDPEIMFYNGCTYRSDGLLTIEYRKPADFILKAADTVSRKADEIISEIISPGMSDYEKELAIHDYLVNSCRYDVGNFERDSVPPEGREAYGPIIAGKAVCGGYAKAMKLLLARAGVECLVVTGTSKGENHAWNIVNISGRYYHVDVTWDDPVMDGGNQILSRAYFNLTDADIRMDHDWDESDYPSCTSLDDNYYYHNGLTVSSEAEFAALMKKAVENGRDSMSARFVKGSAKGLDFAGLLERTAAGLNLRSITYSVNEIYGIVDVWFR